MRKLVAATLLVLVAACSGGGGKASSSPTPSPSASPTPKPPWTLSQACNYLLKIRTEGNTAEDKIGAVAKKYNAGKVSWRVVRDTARASTPLRIRQRRQISFPPDPWPAPMASDMPAYRKGFLLNDSWENAIGLAKTRQEMLDAFSSTVMGQSTEDAYTAARESLKATCNWPK